MFCPMKYKETALCKLKCNYWLLQVTMGHCVKGQLMMKDNTQPGDHRVKGQSMMKDNTEFDHLKVSNQ